MLGYFTAFPHAVCDGHPADAVQLKHVALQLLLQVCSVFLQLFRQL